MRIAQLAPLAESVPPKLYGGTERVVAWLVDELVDLGHDVTLFASGGSRTRGNLHPVWPHALRLGRKGADPNAACTLLLEAIAKRASDFDVIHAHIDWLPLPLLSRLGVPFLTTMHGRLDLPGLPDVIREFPKANFVSISEHQRLPIPDANWSSTIQHGLPVNLFRPSYGEGSYLAFLGRLTAEKGPEDAIRIARAAGKPLHIAAKIPRAETAYFKKHLQPHIDGEKVKLVGEVNEVGGSRVAWPLFLTAKLSSRHCKSRPPGSGHREGARLERFRNACSSSTVLSSRGFWSSVSRTATLTTNAL